MPVERPHFEPRSGQPRSDFAHIALRVNLNLLRGRAERDALIDRVVSFGATDRKVTVLNTPVAFDSTVIDVTPPSPGAPGGDLSHDLVNRSLSPEARASSQLQTAFVLTEFSQPKLPEKKKKLGGLRSVAVKGTLLFTGAGLVVGACTPAQRAILESAFPCAPGPIAGAADGDTAVIENPNQITISGNNFDDKKEAIICLPTGQTVSVEPTPTPKPTPEAIITKDQFDKDIINGSHPKVSFKTAAQIVLQAYADNPEALPFYQSYFSQDPQIEINRCKTGTDDGKKPNTPDEKQIAFSLRQMGCGDTGAALIYEYGKTKKIQFYAAYKIWTNYVLNEKAFQGKGSPFKEQYLSTSGEMFDIYVH